jgi:AraC-like DNA-binding protein
VRATVPASPHIAKTLSLALWRSLQFEWLWVYRGLVPGPTHWSGDLRVPAGIFLVETGRADLRFGKESLEVPAGHMFFAAPGTRRQWFARGTRLLSVGFRVHWPAGAPLHRDGLNCALPASNARALQEATLALLHHVHGRDRITFREATGVPDLTLAGHAEREAFYRAWFGNYIATLDALGIFPATQRASTDSRVQLLLERLDEWPLSRPLDRAELFAGLPVGARRLEQLFAQELRVAPAAYFEARRAEAARERLAGSASPLKETAHALGFRHPSHFTLWFRRHTGQSPSAYRQRHREALV